jgi:hypothetical protein
VEDLLNLSRFSLSQVSNGLDPRIVEDSSSLSVEEWEADQVNEFTLNAELKSFLKLTQEEFQVPPAQAATEDGNHP